MSGRDGSLSLHSSPCGHRVPSLLRYQWYLLCRAAAEGADDMAPGTVGFVTDLISWPDTLSGSFRLPPSCYLSLPVRSHLSALAPFGSNSFWRWIPQASISLLFQLQVLLVQALQLPSLSLCKHGLSWELVFAEYPPKSRLKALRRSLQLSSCFLLVFVWVLTSVINGNSVQQPHGLEHYVFPWWSSHEKA